MGILGPQDFWVVGNKFRFKREDDAAGNCFPLVDFGVVSNVEPATEATTIELFDAGCGIRSKVDEEVTEINESYTVTFRNFSPQNLAFLFLSKPPEELTIASTPVIGAETDSCVKLANLLQVKDAVGNDAFNLASIERVTLMEEVINAVNTAPVVGSQTIDITTGVDKTAVYAVGRQVRIRNNVGLGVDLTVTINATSFAASETTITVDEDIAGMDASGTAAVLLVLGTDYDVESLDLGTICITEGGTVVIEDENLSIDYTPVAISGLRRIRPQSAPLIKGTGYLWFNRGNCAQMTVRIARMSIIPAGANNLGGAEDFADWSATVSVLSTAQDLQLAQGIGTLDAVKGPIPALPCPA